MFDRKSDIIRFLTVVEIGNALVAARELGLTRQAMSYTLGVLKRRAGGTLFESRPAGLCLTPLGVEAEALARRLLLAHEDGGERLHALRKRAARRSKFTLRLPPDLEARLEARLASLPDRVSKNQWLVAAAREKLDREA